MKSLNLLGHYSDGLHDEWIWDRDALKKLDEASLYSLYKELEKNESNNFG